MTLRQIIRWTGIWAAVCLLFVSQNALRFTMRGLPVDWFNAVWIEALYWVPWLALTPVLLATARRWPLGSGAPRANIAWHLAAMVGISSVQVLVADALQYAAGVAHGAFTGPQTLQRTIELYALSL